MNYIKHDFTHTTIKPRAIHPRRTDIRIGLEAEDSQGLCTAGYKVHVYCPYDVNPLRPGPKNNILEAKFPIII